MLAEELSFRVDFDAVRIEVVNHVQIRRSDYGIEGACADEPG